MNGIGIIAFQILLLGFQPQASTQLLTSCTESQPCSILKHFIHSHRTPPGMDILSPFQQPSPLPSSDTVARGHLFFGCAQRYYQNTTFLLPFTSHNLLEGRTHSYLFPSPATAAPCFRGLVILLLITMTNIYSVYSVDIYRNKGHIIRGLYQLHQFTVSKQN